MLRPLAANGRLRRLSKWILTSSSEIYLLGNCRGYDKTYYMLNTQKITDLSLAVYKGKPSIDRKLQDTSIRIAHPRAGSKAYSTVLAWYGDAIAARQSVTDKSKSYQIALDDINAAIDRFGMPEDFVVGTDDFTLGTFSLSSASDLYLNYDSSKGKAPRPQ